MNLDMVKGNPWKLIIKFMIPLAIGNIFQQFYNMVDTIIVGRYVGVDALAAVGATGNIVFLIIGFMGGLTSGFTVLTAQKFGAKDEDGLKRSVANGVILAFIITTVIMVFALFNMKKLLILMNTPEDIFDLAYSYIFTLIAGMYATVLYNMMSGLLRAVGNSIVPLVTLIGSAILNIFLDIFLITKFNMGVTGAALATVISQLVSGIACLIYVFNKVKILIPEKKQIRFDWSHYAGKQFMIGIPMALQFSITAIGTIILQSCLNMLGSTVIASNTAASKVEMLLTQPFIAMGQTMATYSAQNYGVYDIKRIKQGTRISCILTAAYGLIIGVVINFLVNPIVHLFVKDITEEMLGYTHTYIMTVAVFFIPLGLIFVFRNVQQGMGYSLMPMLAGVMELLGRAVVALIGAHFLSYQIIIAANPAAWLAADLLLIPSYLLLMKKIHSSVTVI